jgi:hypothetical protein
MLARTLTHPVAQGRIKILETDVSITPDMQPLSEHILLVPYNLHLLVATIEAEHMRSEGLIETLAAGHFPLQDLAQVCNPITGRRTAGWHLLPYTFVAVPASNHRTD